MCVASKDSLVTLEQRRRSLGLRRSDSLIRDGDALRDRDLGEARQDRIEFRR
jgi:hypothetical protein